MSNDTDLTLNEAAARTKMAVKTIRGWITSGRLPARKIGPQGQYRISPDELAAFLDRR